MLMLGDTCRLEKLNSSQANCDTSRALQHGQCSPGLSSAACMWEFTAWTSQVWEQQLTCIILLHSQEELKQQRIAERETKEKQKIAEREAKDKERKKRAKEEEKRRVKEEALKREEQERIRKVHPINQPSALFLYAHRASVLQ